MYDNDSLASQTRAVPAGSMTHDDASEATLLSLHQLRSALVELSTALNKSLRDERSSAAACLQRVHALLGGMQDTSLQSPEPLAQKPSDSIAPSGLAPWQVRRVLAHIEANLGAPLKNKDLAAIVRLSTFHFAVAFRASVGESPHEHIIRRRVERAQGQMLSTDKSLTDIAAECGFADQAHLTRLFRRIVGDSPAAWRRARANPFW